MVAGSRAVKQTAKEVLKFNYLDIVFALFIPLVAYFICEILLSFISFLNNNILFLVFRTLLSLFIVSPLILGSIRYVWRLLFGVREKTISIFYYYSNRAVFIKTLSFIVRLFFKIVLFALFLYIPATFISIISNQQLYSILGFDMPFWLGNLKNISYLFYGLGTVALPFVTMKYYIAPLLFVADEDIDPSEAIYMSKVIARGTISDFLFLILTFSGWIISCIFVFPTPLILPYLVVAYAVHCRFAIADYNKQVKEPKKDDMLFYSI